MLEAIGKKGSVAELQEGTALLKRIKSDWCEEGEGTSAEPGDTFLGGKAGLKP